MLVTMPVRPANGPYDATGFTRAAYEDIYAWCRGGVAPLSGVPQRHPIFRRQLDMIRPGFTYTSGIGTGLRNDAPSSTLSIWAPASGDLESAWDRGLFRAMEPSRRCHAAPSSIPGLWRATSARTFPTSPGGRLHNIGAQGDVDTAEPTPILHTHRAPSGCRL